MTVRVRPCGEAGTSVLGSASVDTPSAPPKALAERESALAGPSTADVGEVCGWGRVMQPGREVRDENLERLTEDAVLCRGLGRSYGDSSPPPPGVHQVAGTTLADRVLSFDPRTLCLRAEAGLSLRDLLQVFFPRG